MLTHRFYIKLNHFLLPLIYVSIATEIHIKMISANHLCRIVLMFLKFKWPINHPQLWYKLLKWWTWLSINLLSLMQRYTNGYMKTKVFSTATPTIHHVLSKLIDVTMGFEIFLFPMSMKNGTWVDEFATSIRHKMWYFLIRSIMFYLQNNYLF